MITILRVCCFLLVPLCNPMSAAPQGVLLAIEGSVKSNEPAWQLSEKEQQPNSTIYRWKSGQEEVVAEVFVTPSKQAASDLLQKYAFRVPVPPKEKPKDLGDEALVFQSSDVAGGMILFRESNVFILITGSSITVAKRFANHIGSVIPDK